MKQLKASMPDELAELLERASAKSGRSLSAEICTRIVGSFVPADKPTADFLEGAARIAVEIERERGAAWHKHAGAHQALTRAIEMRLRELKPEGPTVFDANWPHATTSEADPNKLGEMIEFRLRRQPDFTNSPMRRFLEEDFQRSRGLLENLVQRSDTPLPARVEAERQQKQKADQQRKRGKKS